MLRNIFAKYYVKNLSNKKLTNQTVKNFSVITNNTSNVNGSSVNKPNNLILYFNLPGYFGREIHCY